MAIGSAISTLISMLAEGDKSGSMDTHKRQRVMVSVKI